MLEFFSGIQHLLGLFSNRFEPPENSYEPSYANNSSKAKKRCEVEQVNKLVSFSIARWTVRSRKSLCATLVEQVLIIVGIWPVCA